MIDDPAVPAPKLRLRRLPIDTINEAVAYLPRRSAGYRPEAFEALQKLELRCNGRRVVAVLNIIDHDAVLAADEIGVSEQGFALFGVAEGSAVEVVQAPPPRSLDAVRRKIAGEELSREDFRAIVEDIVARLYSRMEIAAFLIASASFLTAAEVLSLTEAMARAGRRLEWPEGLVVDKHCIGGIPGNRTSMIVVPIVAAHGLLIPKTSSRAITSPAGTADTMEVLARVDLEIDEMQRIVREEKGCLAWGGHVNLSPADDLMIAVERPLAIDTPEQMVASILSKKLAAGSARLLVDIPVGPSAKIRSATAAMRLRKLFEFIGDRVGLGLEVVVTDGSQPIGRGIGPVLEARDVMQVLQRDPAAPRDLEERAVALAGRILEFDPALRGGEGVERARALLWSGAALAKMERICAAQGAPPATTAPGPLRHEVTATDDGVVEAIDCLRMAQIARLAGAPRDKGAGVDLLKKVGDPVERGEPLYRIHSSLAADYVFARRHADADAGFRLAPRRATAGLTP